MKFYEFGDPNKPVIVLFSEPAVIGKQTSARLSRCVNDAFSWSVFHTTDLTKLSETYFPIC